MKLHGKTALVTGAGDGIGKAVAIALAEAGAKVHATSRTLEKMTELPGRGIAAISEMDVVDEDRVAQVIGTADRLDILVNAAGIVCSDTLDSCDPKALLDVFQTNVIGAAIVARAALPMLRTDRGAIINIASVISSLKGAAQRFSYGTSKAALIGMTKSIAVDFAPQGIRCNAICPGTIETPSLRNRIDAASDPQGAYQAYLSRHPLGCLGRPEHIAALCVFLGGDTGVFVTGQTFTLDGGMTA